MKCVACGDHEATRWSSEGVPYCRGCHQEGPRPDLLHRCPKHGLMVWLSGSHCICPQCLFDRARWAEKLLGQKVRHGRYVPLGDKEATIGNLATRLHESEKAAKKVSGK